MVSGILLALDDKFFKPDDLLGDETTTDGQLIYDAIQRRLKASNVGPDAKRDKLMSEFSIIRTSARLNEVDAKLGKTPLKFYTEFLKKNVFDNIKYRSSSEDFIGRFYGEFMRYSGGDGQTLGIVLTPRHICDLFCDLLNIQTTDIVLDPCCGTAGFLVAAMHHMLEKAGADQNKRKNIKKKQLHGFELQSNMFAIAATNMILRDDGNSNIKCEDFLRQNPAQVQLKGATVGMMNPPYSQGTKSDPSQYELSFVEHLYEIFRTTRSIQSTAKQMNGEGFHTPSGAAFNASTTRLVLRNPIYCTADKRSYDYFIDHDGNVFGDMTEFDGTHGLSAYNKTDQEKYEGSDSTFISPKYVQTIESKPVSEWIIAVGRHEGFIPSEQWIEVQELLDAIAEKYNRPHRKTNALLAGLVHCPYCGRRLSVISESDRWTNGKPRFKYVCPGYRKKECNFKAVDGVLLDEFVVQQLSELSDENSERFRRILEIKIEEVLEQSQTVQEHNLIKKKRDKLKADIAAQTRNLREANGSIKQFIQEDLKNLAEELRETERQLSKLDEGRKNNMIAIRDLEMTKERLLSFAEYAKDAQPEVLVTLIQTIVERIYIVDKDDERYCHIFIKGCSGEDYTGFFQTAGYIEQNTVPVCDSEQYCICTKISETSNIWTDSDRYREHPKKTVRV